MSVPSSKREILSALFHADAWLDLYELHENYKLSPGVLAQSVQFLQENGLLETDGMRAKLTAEGRAWVFLNRKKIFYSVNRFWSQPYTNEEPKVDGKDPYMPRMKSIDKDFFQKNG